MGLVLWVLVAILVFVGVVGVVGYWIAARLDRLGSHSEH